jgi:hypothetical protein
MKRKSELMKMDTLNARSSPLVRDAFAKGFLVIPNSPHPGLLSQFYEVCKRASRTAIVVFPPIEWHGTLLGRISVWAHNLQSYSLLLNSTAERFTLDQANPHTASISIYATPESAESIAKELSACIDLDSPNLIAMLPPAPDPVPLEVLAKWLEHLPFSELNWALMRLLQAGKIRAQNEEYKGQIYRLFKSSGNIERVEIFIRRSRDSQVIALLRLFLEGKIDLSLGLRRDQQPDLLWRANQEVATSGSCQE